MVQQDQKVHFDPLHLELHLHPALHGYPQDLVLLGDPETQQVLWPQLVRLVRLVLEIRVIPQVLGIL